jgi:penicillin-binding protein 2
MYDRYLRGQAEIKKVVVNSSGDVVASAIIQEEKSGGDLVLSIDARIQKKVERSLEYGILAARGAFHAPAGAAVMMDPNTGQVVAMASYPTYNPRVVGDGISNKENKRYGARSPNNPDDDAFLNRAIQAQRQPGSTFKPVTAGAAFALDLFGAYDTMTCPAEVGYPPGAESPTIFHNWTTIDIGSMDTSKALEISCDTFFYELGWDLETTFNEQEEFQKYIRLAGFGDETGLDLPNEAEGRVPDRKWCKSVRDQGLCQDGWLPGYSVNMAIGQGDLIVTPIQMAVTYAALINGGVVWEPRVVSELARNNEKGNSKTIKEFTAPEAGRLPLDATEFGVIQQGLIDVVASGAGTANDAFGGYPLSSYQVAGKTGTAELGETDLSDAWFISYAPAYSPRYVLSVYIEKAGHGGETAAPLARDIWEAVSGIDNDTDFQIGQDAST